jgi:rhodanese-related sulfurtransferase
MTAIAIGFGLVIVTSAFFLIKGSGTADKGPGTVVSEAESSSPLPTMTVVQLRAVLTSQSPDTTVVDLRSAEAFKAAHAAGSVLAADVADLSAMSGKGGSSFVLIPSGDNAADRKASESMKSGGEKHAFIVDGLSAWQEAGGSIVTEPNLSSPIDRSKVTLISADDWKGMFAKRDIPYRVLDIRSAEESSKAVIGGAIAIPYVDLEQRWSEIPYASNIALCATNAEDAFRGAVRLFDLGFFSVKTLDGSCVDIR